MTPKLSAKAEELLARIEARDAKRKAHQDKSTEATTAPEAKAAPSLIGMGPNPLDLLVEVGCRK